MFGMGMPEILLILAIALIVIGPKKLPDLAKSLGRALNEFKHAANEFKDSMDIENDIRKVKKSFDDVEAELKPKKGVELKPKKTDLEGSAAPATRNSLSAKPAETAPGEKTSDQSADEVDIMPPPALPSDRKDEEEAVYAATDIPPELLAPESLTEDEAGERPSPAKSGVEGDRKKTTGEDEK